MPWLAQASPLVSIDDKTEMSSPVRSQAGDDSDAASSQNDTPATQQPFLTQDPHEHVLKDPTRGHESMPSEQSVTKNFRNMNSDVVRREHTKISNSNNSNLLELLALQHHIPVKPSTIKMSRSHSPGMSMSQDSAISAQSNPSTQAEITPKSFLLQPLSNSKRAKDTARLHSKANSQSSRAISSSGDVLGYNKEKIEVRPQVEQNLIYFLKESDKENSQEDAKQPLSDTGGKAECFISDAVDGERIGASRVEFHLWNDHDDGDLWHGKSRIPRRFVQVPRDQRDLLEQESSWFQSAISARSAYANIPPKVLENLKTFHGRHPPTTEAQDISASNDGGSSNENSDGELESDECSEQQDMHRANNGPLEDAPAGLHQTLSSASSRFKVVSAPALAMPGSEGDMNDVGLEDDSDAVSWSASEHESRSTPENTRLPIAASLGHNLREMSPRSEDTRIASPQSTFGGQEDLQYLSSPAERFSQPNIGSNQKKLTTLSRFLAGPDVPAGNPADDDELELVVPYAIDDVPRRDDKGILKSSEIASQCISSNTSLTDVMQVTRTPHLPRAISRRRLSSMSQDGFDARAGCLAANTSSSNPIIPSTFDGANSADTGQEQTSRDVPTPRKEVESRIVVSGSPLLPAATITSFHNKHDRQYQQEDWDDDPTEDFSSRQLYIEYETYSQRSSSCRRGSSPATTALPSYVQGQPSKHALNPCASVQRGQSSRSRGSVEECFEEQFQLSKKTSMPSSPFQPQQLQRVFKGVSFGFSQDDTIPTDPSEISKANRNKFLMAASISDVSTDSTNLPAQGRTLPSDQLESTFQISASTTKSLNGAQILENSGGEPASILTNTAIQSNFSSSSNRQSSSSGAEDPFMEKIQDKERFDTQSQRTKAKTGKDLSQDKFDNFQQNTPHQQNIPQSPTVAMFSRAFSAEGLNEKSTIFMRYSDTYPDYLGSLKSFIRACYYIKWLRQMKKAPHPSLWDDFVRAFSQDYSAYVESLKISGQKPISGLEYYNNEILDPVFISRVLNSSNLEDVFLLDTEETSKVQRLFHQKEKIRWPEKLSTTLTSHAPKTTGDMLSASPESTSKLSKLSARSARSTIPLPSSPYEDVSNNVGLCSKAPLQQPFFETTSQLAILANATSNGPDLQSTLVPSASCGAIEIPSSDDNFSAMTTETMALANFPKKTVRRSPGSWPHSSGSIHGALEVNRSEQRQLCDETQFGKSGRQDITKNAASTPKIGSPILGSSTLDEMLERTVDDAPNIGLATWNQSRTEPMVKPKGHPVAEISEWRRAIVPDGKRNSPGENIETAMIRTNPQVRSFASSLKRDLSYEEFIRSPAYKRLKRRSGGTSSSSTPFSTPSSGSRIVSRVGRAQVEEPETQPFSF